MVTMSAVVWLSAAALIFVVIHVPSSVLSQTDRECTWVSVIHYMLLKIFTLGKFQCLDFSTHKSIEKGLW